MRPTTSWHDDAACNDPNVNPDWFFPDTPGSHATRKAKQICAGCQVRDICLDTALHQTVSGIWGGTSEQQRIAMRRERGISLPTGWAAHKHVSRWERRYCEMRDLGYRDVEIAKRFGVAPASMTRQMHRYGIHPSPTLVAEARIERSKASR